MKRFVLFLLPLMMLLAFVSPASAGSFLPSPSSKAAKHQTLRAESASKPSTKALKNVKAKFVKKAVEKRVAKAMKPGKTMELHKWLLYCLVAALISVLLTILLPSSLIILASIAWTAAVVFLILWILSLAGLI